MDYKLSDGKRKFRMAVLLCVYLLGLVPIIYSILEFVYDKDLFMPTWLTVVLTILGQVLPLGFYIFNLTRGLEGQDDKTRSIYSLFFMASILNRSLLSTRPYSYIKYFDYTPLRAWAKYFTTPLLLIAVALLAWIYVLIRDKKNKNK